jgi:hypothetical protein
LGLPGCCPGGRVTSDGTVIVLHLHQQSNTNL